MRWSGGYDCASVLIARVFIGQACRNSAGIVYGAAAAKGRAGWRCVEGRLEKMPPGVLSVSLTEREIELPCVLELFANMVTTEPE